MSNKSKVNVNKLEEPISTDDMDLSGLDAQFFQYSTELAADEVFWMRPDSSIFYVNKSACAKLGYTRDELLGMKVWEWDPLFPKEVWPDFWANLCDKKHLLFETRHMTKEGHEFPVEIQGHHVRSKGQEFLIAYVTDISERVQKESEIKTYQTNLEQILEERTKHIVEQKQLFEELINLVPVMINSFDADGKCSLWNRACEETLGFSFAEAQANTDLMSQFYPDPEVRQRIIHDITNPDGEFRQYPVVVRDGTIRQQLWSNFKLVNGMMIGCGVDITSLKETEEQLEQEKQKLKETLKKLHLVAEGSRDGFWHWTDPVNDKVEWSDNFYRLLGYRPQAFEPSFTFFQSILHPDDVELTRQAVDEAIKAKTNFDIEYRIKNKEGSYRWFRGRGTPYYDNTGEFVEMAGSIADIQKRKLLEFEVLESNKRYNLAVEGVGVGLWTWDIATNENYWSPTFFCLLGFEDNEIDASFPEWEKRLHPDDKERVFAALDAHLKQESGYHIEFRLLCKNDQFKWFKVKGKAEFDAQGNPLRMAGNLEDVHERKILELENKRLLEVFDKTFDMVGQISADLKLLYLNNAFRERTGLTGPLDQIPFNAQHTEDQLRVIDETVMPAVMEHGIWEGELGIKDKFGKEVPCSCISIAHKNERNEPEYFTAIFRDISEIKRQKEKAEHASLVKSQFLANMSHEIRTPMNGVIGMTNQLLKTELDDKQLKSLMTVKSSANSLLSIINDILDLSKIEAGKLQIEKTSFSLVGIINDVTSTTSVMAKEKALELVVKCDNGISENGGYQGDPTRLRQVLLNLVSNAIKFTHKGSVTVSVKLLDACEEKDVYRFDVADTGIGIEQAAQEKLFKPFSQEDESTTRQFGGTGLGLSICKQLVELMGGHIDFSSERGKGSSFWFDLPLEKTLLSKEKIDQEESENWEDMTFPGVKALLVEDNSINREVAIMNLEDAEIEVDSAEDGSIAVKLVKENDYDIVFMDCQMPVMDGYTATRQIRTLEKAKVLPIIALTANAMEGEKKKCLEAGMTDYLSKPFEYEDILKKLEKFLPDRKK